MLFFVYPSLFDLVHVMYALGTFNGIALFIQKKKRILDKVIQGYSMILSPSS